MLPPRPELPPTSARSQWRSITVGSQRAALGIMRKSMKRPLRLFVNPSERQALAAALEQVISDVKADLPHLAAPLTTALRFSTVEDIDADAEKLRQRFQIASFNKTHLEKQLAQLADLLDGAQTEHKNVVAPAMPAGVKAVLPDAWLTAPGSAATQFWLPYAGRLEPANGGGDDDDDAEQPTAERFVRASKRLRPWSWV